MAVCRRYVSPHLTAAVFGYRPLVGGGRLWGMTWRVAQVPQGNRCKSGRFSPRQDRALRYSPVSGALATSGFAQFSWFEGPGGGFLALARRAAHVQTFSNHILHILAAACGAWSLQCHCASATHAQPASGSRTTYDIYIYVSLILVSSL